MIKITKRNRTELKSFFVKNAIPTEVEFADLIDGMVNQKEDGFTKLPGNPLSIEASGDAASQKKAINFYKDFSDENPDWVLSLNPRSDPADAATAHAGLSISDATGNSRLFIDKSTGNVGIGTVAPMQTLDINGGIHVKNGVIQKGGSTITNTSDLGLYSQEPGQGVRIVSNAAPIRFFTDSGKGTTSRLSIESSGNVSIPGTLTVGTLKAVNGITGDGKLVSVYPLSFVNNWSGYNSPTSYKDNSGIVHLNGSAARINDSNSDSYAFRLPFDHRPSRQNVMTIGLNICSGINKAVRIDVNVNGKVSISSPDPDNIITLSGIVFRTK